MKRIQISDDSFWTLEDMRDKDETVGQALDRLLDDLTSEDAWPMRLPVRSKRFRSKRRSNK